MDKVIANELDIFIKKVSEHSIKNTWVQENLPNLYVFILDKQGESLSEKIYLLQNERVKCTICEKNTKFLSYSRGYRTYCSKKCSNNDSELIKKKSENFKKNNLENWGVDNPAKSQQVIDKIKDSKSKLDINKINKKIVETNLNKYGTDNVSKLDFVKQKKIQTNIDKLGVENPFQSDIIKQKIRETLLHKYGVDHPLKSEQIKEKSKETSLKNWGHTNPARSQTIKDKKFISLDNPSIKTTLNSDDNIVRYLGSGRYEMRCDNQPSHTFEIHRHLYHARKKIGNMLCTICNHIGETKSIKEIELFNWIKSVYDGEIIQNYRDGYEIDIYLPDLSMGFEFNGLYWHSELFKSRYYHINKTNHFADKNIRIIHIWEDDWCAKREIVESQILNWLGLNSNKVFARKCQIKQIKNSSLIRSFLNENHIQGYVRTTLNLGLFFEDNLVSLMTFDHSEGRKSMQKNEWNLSRFCNKTNMNVVGAASKLLKYFIDNFSPSRIISFADKEWSRGDLYSKLGFHKIGDSKPNYKYMLKNKRVNKQRFKKSRLIEEGFEAKMSESEIMLEKGIYKIWDCGQLKFEKIIPERF
jgi:hypothetical protein